MKSEISDLFYTHHHNHVEGLKFISWPGAAAQKTAKLVNGTCSEEYQSLDENRGLSVGEGSLKASQSVNIDLLIRGGHQESHDYGEGDRGVHQEIEGQTGDNSRQQAHQTLNQNTRLNEGVDEEAEGFQGHAASGHGEDPLHPGLIPAFRRIMQQADAQGQRQ